MIPTRDPRSSKPWPAGTEGFVSIEAVNDRIIVPALYLSEPSSHDRAAGATPFCGQSPQLYTAVPKFEAWTERATGLSRRKSPSEQSFEPRPATVPRLGTSVADSPCTDSQS